MTSSQIERQRIRQIEEEVLAINDTTVIDLHRHLGRIKPEGLGYINGGKHRHVGFFLHPTLVIEADSGFIRGLSSIQLWTRPEARTKEQNNYKQRPIQEKESYKWIAAAEQTKRNLPQARRITLIADREADCYEEFVRVPDERTDILIRSCQNRLLSDGGCLYERLAEQEVIGEYEILIAADKRSGQEKRRARIEVRRVAVEIQAARSYQGEQTSCRLQAIEAREVDVPEAVEPILWRLLTTHQVNDYEDACRMIGYYRQRWQIEQLFRTLKKQGLDIESSELESVESIQKLSILALEVAVRTLQLTAAREESGRQMIENVFDKDEIECLKKLNEQLEGKTKKQQNPHRPGEVGYAAWVIARLGGWKGYQTQRPPGVITMKRGLHRFEEILFGFSLTYV